MQLLKEKVIDMEKTQEIRETVSDDNAQDIILQLRQEHKSEIAHLNQIIFELRQKHDNKSKLLTEYQEKLQELEE
jgi:hypothetical protein